MALPITVPFTFANATTTQNLSSLDADFATVYNAVNGIGNGSVSLSNVNITGGNIFASYSANSISVSALQATGTANSTTYLRGDGSWSSGSSGTSISNGTSNVSVASSNGPVIVYTNGSEAMRVNTAQQVSIGTTGASAKLTISSTGSIFGIYTTASGTGTAVYGSSTSGTGINGVSSATSNWGVYGLSTASTVGGGVLGYYQSTVYGILGYLDGSNYWAMYGGGSTYISGTYQGSDERLKDNITTLNGSLEKLSSLRPVSFTWKPDSEQAKSKTNIDYGLIAQEAIKIFPELVKEIGAFNHYEDGHPTNDTLNCKLGKFYGIEYGALIPHLISAIQELKKEIDDLKTKVGA